jgi:hypothetical protein
MLGDEQGIGEYIGQFFFDLFDIGFMGLLPEKGLQEFAGFEIQRDGQIFGVVKLFPVAFIPELYECLCEFVGV